MPLTWSWALWGVTSSPNHFKKVKISALALLKMVMHARSGGNIEVMGMMQGKVEGDTIIVMDAFALPVEGTETRVNASQQGYEYMVNYTSLSNQVRRGVQPLECTSLLCDCKPQSS